MSNISYNATGQELSAKLGNGLTETHTYDKRVRQTSLSVGSVYSWTIPTNGYSPDGDIVSSTDTVNGNWTYSYDQFDRLAGSNQNNGASVYSYTYDRFGNRWQQSGPFTFTASFTGNNPANPQNNNRVDGYSYDAAGNMTSDGFHSYAYDAENRIVAVDQHNTASYTYDAEGRRVVDQSGALLYDLDDHAFDVIGGGLHRQEVYIPGGRHLATYVANTTYFTHTDHLGTERMRTTVSGAVFETCTSLPFGDVLSCTGTDDSPYHFTGKPRDHESGLDNFGARYNSSSMGRFMSPDPVNLTWKRLINPGNTLNKYTYAANNPLLYVDPNGKDITVFYRQSSGAAGDAGHVLLAVTNQQTGQVRFVDYYPKGAKGFTPAPGEMNQGETSDRLKQHAALTIRTTPEIAQKLIDRIDALSPPNQPPDFMIPFSDCVVVCADLLNIAGTMSLPRLRRLKMCGARCTAIIQRKRNLADN